MSDADGNLLEPDPHVAANVSVTNVPYDTCAEDLWCFEDDGASQDDLSSYGWELDDRLDNPIRVYPHKVDQCHYDESGCDIGQGWHANISDKDPFASGSWTTSTDANDTVEWTTRNGVPVIHIAPGSWSNGNDDDTITFDPKDITSDTGKLRFKWGVEVLSVDSSAENLQVEFYDANGTGYDRFTINPTASSDGSNHHLVNSTGTVFWDELVTEGYSDHGSGGIDGDIGKIVVTAKESSNSGSLDVYFYAFGLDTKRTVFGQDHEGNNVYNMTYGDDGNTLDHLDLATWNPNYKFQNHGEKRISVTSPMSKWSEAKVFDADASDGFHRAQNYRGWVTILDRVDLTWKDTELQYPLPVADTQHQLLSWDGGDELTTIDNKDAGAMVTLASGLSAGQEYEFEATLDFTKNQWGHISEEGIQGVAGGFYTPADGISYYLNLFLVGIVGFLKNPGVLAGGGVAGAAAWAIKTRRAA